MRRLIIAASVTVAGVVGFGGVASATEASVKMAQRCESVENRTWSVTVTLVNQWDGSTTFTIDAEENVQPITLTGKTSKTLAPFITSADSMQLTVTDNHPDHFTNPYPSTWNRPAGCGDQPTTTVPPSTTTVPAPTTTVKVCEDGLPPRIPVEDGSLVCPEFGAPPDQQPTTTTAAPLVASSIVQERVPTTVCTKPGETIQPGVPFCGTLPTTGGGDDEALIWVAVTMIAVGGLLLLAREIDRRQRS
jgi:hypothetical protein